MHIQLEPHEAHTIQAYHDTSIKINNIIYHDNLIVSRHHLITPWNVSFDPSCNQTPLKPILELEPELIILGARNPYQLRQSILTTTVPKGSIGIECMSLDAACRTFNILLSEHRNIVAGFIMTF